jgi:hypothetical protein
MAKKACSEEQILRCIGRRAVSGQRISAAKGGQRSHVLRVEK